MRSCSPLLGYNLHYRLQLATDKITDKITGIDSPQKTPFMGIELRITVFHGQGIMSSLQERLTTHSTPCQLCLPVLLSCLQHPRTRHTCATA
jgi:hypothetical protein